jgi:hypothetical protein
MPGLGIGPQEQILNLELVGGYKTINKETK